jgi:hypothetical protein
MAPLRQAIPQEGATDSEMVKKRRRGKRHAAEINRGKACPAIGTIAGMKRNK